MDRVREGSEARTRRPGLPQDEVLPLVGDPGASLYGHAWRYRGRYLLGLAALSFTDLLELAAPAIIAGIFDSLTAGRTSTWIYAGLPALLVVVVAAQGVLRYFWRVGFVFTSLHIAHDLRRAFFAKLTRLPQSFYQERETGDLLSRASNDVEAVRMFLGIGLLIFADSLFYFLFVPVLLYMWSPRLTLWLLVGLPILPLVVRRISLAVHARFEAVQEQLSTLSAHAQESFAGVLVVRGQAREEAELARFAAHASEYRRRNLALWRVQTWMGPTMLLAVIIEEAIVILVGGQEVLAGTLTAGQFVAFFFYLLMLTQPMEGLGWVLSLYQRGRASHGRLREVMEEDEVIDDRRADPGADVTDGEIVLERVTFRHPGSPRPALSELSLRLPAGATLGVVGRIGAGKTTLARLALRLVEPTSGRILIDGRDQFEIPLTRLRRAIGYVPQETFLFSGTVAENIGLSLEVLDPGPIARAASMAALDDELAAWPDGMQTLIGERGVTLSGGQKQRVALARALASDPRILVLDDCLSAVDPSTERRILEALAGARRGRTTILISHRLATVADADMILVLEDGQVQALGRHAELLAADGWYARTFRDQEAERS